MTFSMAESQAAMTVRLLAFPADAAISLPVQLECGRQLMAATPLSVQRIGT
jgi:hypothetical protein